MRKTSRLLALLAIAAGCNSGTSNQAVPDSGQPASGGATGGTTNSATGGNGGAAGGTGGSSGTGGASSAGGGSGTAGMTGSTGGTTGNTGGTTRGGGGASSAGGTRGSGGVSGMGGGTTADALPPADAPVTGADAARDAAPDLATTGSGGAGGSTSRVSVLQHHNNASRDGVYVDSALSKTAVAGLHVDPAFAGATVSGPTYAQPLYLAGANGSPDLVIVATEQNHVYAFDAGKGGKSVWDVTLATPLPRSRLSSLRAGCGNIDPLGVTGTPVIDGASRTIYLDAMTIASANATAQHQVYALDADTGATKSGWPVDLNSKVSAGSTTFDSLVENQRGALILLDGKVFVPFGGHIGDCSTYRGWIVGISTTDPTQVSAWVTRALAGGVWAPGGIASDGKSLYFATGNTENQANTFSAPSTWSDGETIFRLPSSLSFSGQNVDYFTPTNWAALDNADTDIGGTAPVVFDLPGATPSTLVIGLGKDGNAYVLNRASLGGIVAPMTVQSVATGNIINAAAVYKTTTATYVVFKGTGKGCPSGQSGGLVAAKISAASPPTVSVAWCGGPSTQESPMVSMTDAQGTDAIVWIVGSDNKLYGLDGDTGKAIFSGGGSGDTMSAVQKFNTPIVANGRIFVAANNQVYAFAP
jgi:hypothetical protein